MKQTIHCLSLFLLFLSLFLSLFFLFKVREQNQLIDKLIDTSVIIENLNDRERIVLSLSREIFRKTNKGINIDDLDLYSRIESTSFFNVSSAVSLRYGGYGIIGHSVFGPCGSMSRTLLNALWRLKIPARKLQLLDNELGQGGGHTMIEFYHKGAWRVCSPSDSTFVWWTEDGEIATAEQIQNDPTIFSQIYITKPNYPYLFDNYWNIRWKKLPDWMTSMIKLVIGDSRFRSSKTPKLFDLPRSLFFNCSMFSLFFFAMVTYVSRPKKPIEEHVTEHST